MQILEPRIDYIDCRGNHLCMIIPIFIFHIKFVSPSGTSLLIRVMCSHFCSISTPLFVSYLVLAVPVAIEPVIEHHMDTLL